MLSYILIQEQARGAVRSDARQPACHDWYGGSSQLDWATVAGSEVSRGRKREDLLPTL